MKITFISDTHFNCPQTFATIQSDGFNSRFLDQLSVFNLIPKDTDVLCHIGDVFHSKFNVNKMVYDRVFLELDNLSCEKIIVAGNHDHYSENSINSLYSFRGISNVISHGYTNFKIDNTIIHCVPFNSNTEKYKGFLTEAKSNINKAFINILLTHCGVLGAKVGSTNYSMIEDIELADLYPDYFDYIFLGHYHKYQELADCVWYVGSPLQLNFSETEEQKGIITLDTKTRKFSFIENTIAPKFHVIKITSMKQLAKLNLNEKDFYRLDCEVEVDRSILNQVASGKNVIVEGGVGTKREARLKSDNVVDIISEYVLSEVTDEFEQNKLIEMGRSFI